LNLPSKSFWRRSQVRVDFDQVYDTAHTGEPTDGSLSGAPLVLP
jgi:hypothetical protein